MSMKFFRQLRCNHQYKTITNIGGDAIYLFGGARSFRSCKLCGKHTFRFGLDGGCHKVNEFY